MVNSIELARDFWEKKCLYHIQMFEYGKYSKDEFVTNMGENFAEVLGWDEKQTLSLMAEE